MSFSAAVSVYPGRPFGCSRVIVASDMRVSFQV